MLTGYLRPIITLNGRIVAASGGASGDHSIESGQIIGQENETTTQNYSYSYITQNALTFDGTQYISLNITPKNTTRVEVAFKRSATSDYAFVFGSRSAASANDGVALAYNPSNCYPIFGSARASISGAAAVDTVHTAVICQDGYFLDVAKLKSYDDMSFLGTYPLCIGGVNTGGSIDSRRYKGELYAVDIYENDVLQASLVPATRVSDNAVGLIDLVSLTFYEQTGAEET